LADLRGFRPIEPSWKIALLDDPLLTFRSPPEHHCTDAAPDDLAIARDCLPCGFFPFGVFPVPASYLLRRRPTPGYVPSRRFAHPQGLVPPGTCRPCFMPVPPMGFSPSGPISTRRAAHPLGCPCPHEVGVALRLPSRPARHPTEPGIPWFTPSVSRGDGTPPTRPSSGLCSLRAFVSPGRLFRPSRSHDPRGVPPPWGFLLRCRRPSRGPSSHGLCHRRAG